MRYVLKTLVVIGFLGWCSSLFSNGAVQIDSRTDKIKSYPCASCHIKNLLKKGDYKVAHPKISFNHGKLKENCNLCHDKKEPSKLNGIEGKVSLDESHKLCGTCHFSQKRDWLGGAHGKRISGWQEKRKVMACTSCHNPHDPLFKKRKPAIGATPLHKKDVK